MKTNLISVIIPVFNAETNIEACLLSVIKQVGGNNFEVILVNDGSTDSSLDSVLKVKNANPSFDLKVINQENSGVSSARNVGLKIAKGDYIALLDVDDEWMPDKTVRQMEILKDSNVDMIACLRNGERLLPPYHAGKDGLTEITFKKLLIRNTIALPTVIFKRKVLENTGFFQEGQNYAEDHDYWLRATLKNKLYILNENLVITGNGKRSFGESGLSANLWAMFKGFVQNIKRVQDVGRISKIELYLYIPFYFCKYLLLVIRTVLKKQRKS